MLDALFSQLSWLHGTLFLSAILCPLPFYYRGRHLLKTQCTVLEQQYIHCLSAKEQVQSQLQTLQTEHQQLQAEKVQLHGHCQQYQARLTEKQTQVHQFQELWQKSEHNLSHAQAHAHKLEIELTDIKAMFEQKQQAFDAQIAQLKNSKEQLKLEFENIANQIFEEKTARFSQQSQETIDQILKPVQGELKGFRDKMEAIHSEELKQRASLKTELLHLQENNRNITEQASQLTNALQGQKKVQGNWGELMLENVLDSAGLRAGYDYKREVSFSTDDGKYRPDVVVYLPQKRHLVIDAKTSLNAYTRYVNATSEIDANTALIEHSQAVLSRIKELGDKSYERLPGLNSPDVVIMFIPIESAFVEAIKHTPNMYQQALEQNVLVATPTTLLTSMNIVKQLWRFEEQSKHSRELALRAEKFYGKLNSFLHSMEGVGRQLDKARESYDRAFSQLYHGKGNLIKQASDFKELGVSVSKELPVELLEKANLELE
ncbi:DNA recombination protein RmuC [Pseudoalteromonas sp. MMG013]|uniref:DNA recombination protein RmuC n=1 Tax=Pseudoalteromonas aurantia 208 TaxID=1314867 RepID=A0ABR9EGR0_9GAMM|nr:MULTISPECIES: DNA recombination protein RmuC [Pseudoalteromonas]MBE0370181.1 DNA recombination protein RmuC [Pseudoalteromonas aurantia 208]MBQ4846709.1 DNA recombination protein RmuC [Pseudoalteromonas sp. MMG005]MBQ4860386.1 DNA recombination protein RmuC [Pseudoalteromonas sp. MMG013]